MTVDWLSHDFRHAFRAFESAGMLDALARRVAEARIDGPDDALAAFLDVARATRVPESYADVVRFCHAMASVSGKPIRDAPSSVERLSAFLRVPYRVVCCSVPIHTYVAGVVEEPSLLTPSGTTYLVVRDPDKPLNTEALEVQSAEFLDSLLRGEPLEEMLQRSGDVVAWMRWLADLTEARFAVWLLPR